MLKLRSENMEHQVGRFCVLWLRRVVLALGLVAHAFSPNTPETEAGIIPWALGQRVRPCLKRKTKWPPSADFPLNRNLKEAVKHMPSPQGDGRRGVGVGCWMGLLSTHQCLEKNGSSCCVFLKRLGLLSTSPSLCH